MSGPAPQERFYLKVLHDFQYKTAEGREIIIKKNERLYLVQRTNADWWQVVRNLEQRPFYVPATYVREVSKISASSTRKNSEEDRENIFEPPQDPSYKSMPRESSNAMRNVKKWLAGAIDNKSEAPKTFYGAESYQKSDVANNRSRGQSNAATIDHKTKSLERDRRSEQFSDKEEDTSHDSLRSRDSVEYHENSNKINRLSTSPMNSGLQFRMEAALQDPFRRELESSLDRRNLSVKDGGKIGQRVRTRSSNSEGSHANSESSEHKEIFDKVEKEIITKSESRKMNLPVHEESESSGGTSRNSRSLDFEGIKFSLRRERSISPKPLYARQMTFGGNATVYQEKPIASEATNTACTASDDHKILNDKRRTWAVEELMSELTQMCKKRVINKKPAFQLKSTEIKANFDPLEELTRELHEMNRLRTEGNIPEADESPNTNSNVSPINVCKIAINTENSIVKPEKLKESHEEMDKKVNDQSEESPKCQETRKRYPSVTQSETDLAKPLKSPKSPKILDEYNEANILNDCNSLKGSLGTATRSLSPDKQSLYQTRTNSVHPFADSVEVPCYSNIKINADRVKLRPKLKIKTMESNAELKLTPSLEKLANEIQFLPARRTSQTEEGKNASKSTTNDQEGETDEKTFEDACKSDDSLERCVNRGISKHRPEYKGSFKTKREAMYIQSDKCDEDKKSKSSGLKKSNTLHCATIPECYKRFCKNNTEFFEPVLENTIYKRRSRSLSDLELLELNFETKERDVVEIPRIPRCKPVPLPRTKFPAIQTREDSSNEKINTMTIAASNSYDKTSPRTIPEQRKMSREKRENHQDLTNRRGFEYGLSSFYNLTDKYPNNSDVNTRRNINIESSTAVGFKTLLCASDSGSDNCLQSKELLSSSTGNLNDRGALKATRKSNSSANFNDRSKVTRESLSDEQILSSNPSSEALHSHSESEATATLDVSSQPSPLARSEQDTFECPAIDLPPGWTQKYDSDTGQICFLNEQGDKVSINF